MDDVVEECSESTWTRREQARQRQIAIGKARPEYRRFLQEVPREEREAQHPRTPDPRARISKRQFDRTLSAWRCRLHEYDVPRLAGSEGADGIGKLDVQIDGDVTPLARRSSNCREEQSGTTTTMTPSELSGRSSRPRRDEGGIVPLRLADALSASSPMTPCTSGVGHGVFQPMHLGRPHLQLGPRQLDFGAGPSCHLWQAFSPMDGSAVSPMTPMTPAPHVQRYPRCGWQQTVLEDETPDRPSQPDHAIRSRFGGLPSSPSPKKKSQSEVEPPRTPPRKFLLELEDAGSSDRSAGACSAHRNGSPPSVAKTPSYGNWVTCTPDDHMYAPTLAESSGYCQTADMPPMLPVHSQYQPQHHLVGSWGYGLFPGQC